MSYRAARIYLNILIVLMIVFVVIAGYNTYQISILSEKFNSIQAQLTQLHNTVRGLEAVHQFKAGDIVTFVEK